MNGPVNGPVARPNPPCAPASGHDCAPALALAAIAAHDGPLLIDLDETLYLRNSTEDYLDCARPALLAVLLIQALDWLKPWRWTGGAASRDAWRLHLVRVLLPRTTRRWRRSLALRAARHGNRPLIEALRNRHKPVVIVTLGFRSVVTPLVAALGFGASTIVAVRDSGFAASCEDRRRGKRPLVADALGEDTVRNSLVLTDSLDDLPLLAACAVPLRTRWPAARYRRALAGVYRPGRYLSQVKRPGERYVLRGILQEDFAFWLLSSLALAAVPLLHIAGLLLLLLSFWTIYECGYVDNDRIADRFEAEPKLSTSFHASEVATPTLEPWLWALLSGAAAILLLRWPALPTPGDFGRWLALLLATAGWFRLYNRYDKRSRVWLFPGLQLARSAAFAVLVPVSMVGVLALAAHVQARWLPYYVYRFGGKAWPQAPLPLTRLLFFVAMLPLLALTQPAGVLLNWTAAALLGWNLYRARHDLRAVIGAARRIDRPPPPPPSPSASP